MGKCESGAEDARGGTLAGTARRDLIAPSGRRFPRVWVGSIAVVALEISLPRTIPRNRKHRLRRKRATHS